MVPSLSSLPADKVALRRIGRMRRRAFVDGLDAGEREALERQLRDVLEPHLTRSRITGGYSPLPSEISPLPALDLARSNGATIAFPAFVDHRSPFRFLAGDPVETSPWAVLQPSADAPHVHPDLVLVPLVAADRQGGRLGQGKGHYDRVLEGLRGHGALLIGVGWRVQLLDATIPADPWDVALDGFASPEGLEMFR